MAYTHTVADRNTARQIIQELTKGWRTLYGVGNPLHEKHAEVIAYPFEYTVRLKPEGDRANSGQILHVIRFDR